MDGYDSPVKEEVGLLNNVYKHVNDLSVALMCTALKNYSWRTLLDDKHEIPSGHFICGVDCGTYGHAGFIMPIDPYWTIMRDKVTEIDHAYPLNSDSFSKAVSIITKAAYENYGKINVRGGFANDGVNVDVESPGYSVSSASIYDRDEDEELLRHIEKTGRINGPRTPMAGFTKAEQEQFGGGYR
ncbi:hypothetical protein [uncultured Duncaniella sp.]|uniref:hypothetical protein n=1 Tax=uncultured Duncaniella sp. TaxID=2768039 RepID=UPI0026323441|nr:hypothetical protein [uncultured Duncaniella sp.]